MQYNINYVKINVDEIARGDNECLENMLSRNPNSSLTYSQTHTHTRARTHWMNIHPVHTCIMKKIGKIKYKC